MRDFAKFISEMYEKQYGIMMNNIHRGGNGLSCAFFCRIVTPPVLSIANALRNQKFNLSCIVTVLPPPNAVLDTVNKLGLKIVPIGEYSSIEPVPECLFVVDGFSGFIDFTFATNLIKNPPRIMQVAGPGSVRYFNDAYSTYMKHLPEIYEFYASLGDVESRQVFCGFLTTRVSGCLNDGIYARTPHYICEGFLPRAGDIFIDGGSCDGSASALFVNLGCKAYAFEMDKKNFPLAAALGKQKNFVVENLGLGSSNRELIPTAISAQVISTRKATKSRGLFRSILTSKSINCRASTSSNSMLKARSSTF